MKIKWLILLGLVFMISNYVQAEENDAYARWVVKPQIEFIDQYGEDRNIIIEGKEIKYKDWILSIISDLTWDLPDKPYDTYRKKFDQGKLYIRLIFEETDAYPEYYDSQKNILILPDWIYQQIKDQLVFHSSRKSCSVYNIMNVLDNQFIYSGHIPLLAHQLNDKTIKEHIECLAGVLGLNIKHVHYNNDWSMKENIRAFRRKIKEQYWKLR